MNHFRKNEFLFYCISMLIIEGTEKSHKGRQRKERLRSKEVDIEGGARSVEYLFY